MNWMLRCTSSLIWAASLNVSPLKNAWDTSAVKSCQPRWTATELTILCPHLDVVPANVDSCAAWRSLKPRTTRRAWIILLPSTSFHFKTQRASITLVASLRGMRLNAPSVCHRMISSYMACVHAFSFFWASSELRMFCARSTTVCF